MDQFIKRIFCIIFLLGFLVSAKCYSAENSLLVKKMIEIETLIVSKNYQDAYKKLKELEWDYAGDPAFDLLFATVANGIGKYGEAILATERILAVDPENQRARAEIAKSFYLQGEWNSAQYEFQIVKKQGVTPEVSRNIENILSDIHHRNTVKDQSFWYGGFVQFSGGYDSNVNRGVHDDLVGVPLFGQILQFRVNPESLEQSDTFKEVETHLNLRYSLFSNWVVHGGINFKYRSHNEKDDFDIGNLSGYAGIDYKYNKELFTFIYRKQFYHYLNRVYQETDDYLIQWQHAFNAMQRMGVYYEWTELHYPDLEYQDATRNAVGINAAHSFSFMPLVMYGSIYTAEETIDDSRFSILGHFDLGLLVGVRYQMTNQIDLFASFDGNKRLYEGENRLFRKRRKDVYLNTKVGASWNFLKHWEVAAEYNYFDNDSNLEIFKYSRHVVSASMKWSF